MKSQIETVFELAEKLGVGVKEARVLAALKEMGVAKTAEIHKRIGSEPKTTATRLTTLKNKGLVKQKRVKCKVFEWPDWSLTARANTIFTKYENILATNRQPIDLRD